ncbi:hypothetical protein NDU88_003086 [Pleurodeles waltl]|uniref:Uncharacterized protein n=1 Tax=Pleurodeles waltl TaxID=8319 RepID=A0AAV7TPI3_PLEWA|nr:hypothetical protein NDU88_003086 [Pleurodeles waltl]
MRGNGGAPAEFAFLQGLAAILVFPSTAGRFSHLPARAQSSARELGLLRASWPCRGPGPPPLSLHRVLSNPWAHSPQESRSPRVPGPGSSRQCGRDAQLRTTHQPGACPASPPLSSPRLPLRCGDRQAYSGVPPHQGDYPGSLRSRFTDGLLVGHERTSD